jgi:hypothetical protein
MIFNNLRHVTKQRLSVVRASMRKVFFQNTLIIMYLRAN